MGYRLPAPPGQSLPDPDVGLIARVAARDERAMGELYDRHCVLLYSLVLRILRDHGLAEDVLQEVFVSVWTRVDSFNPALGTPAAWLVRIARNRAIDRLRSSGAQLRAVESAPTARVSVITPEDRASAGEQWRAAARVLETLPQEQRILIEDAYFLGLTHAELAARYGVPLGTVKTRIRSGMQTLRQSLASVTSPS